MLIISSALAAMLVGVTIGLNYKRLIRKQSGKLVVQKNRLLKNEKEEKVTEELLPYFDTLEIRFLKRILNHDDKLLSVNEANEILRIERLSKENQRQRRHLFLKDLNVKLKMIYRLPESIERKSTELDRRSKYYRLHSEINKESIEELLNVNY